MIELDDPSLITIHEAGHAIAAHLVGHRIRKITLSDGGHCYIEHPLSPTRVNAEAYISICAGGPVAEARALGIPIVEAFHTAGQTDAAMMKAVAKRFASTPGIGDAGLAAAEWLCRHRFDAIEALAAALLEHGELPGKFAHDLLRIHGVPRLAFGRWITHPSTRARHD